VILREFALRKGSGGEGLHPGGEGVVRDIEFLEPMEVSILSERRVFQPYGIAGGGPGQSGKNLWVQKRVIRKKDGLFVAAAAVTDNDSKDDETEIVFRTVNLSGKNTAYVKAGDRLLVCTPGGGAWGAKDGAHPIDVSGGSVPIAQQTLMRGSVSEYQSLHEASV
jgi:5-oxoprolinase (ATP-hydrolysing)